MTTYIIRGYHPSCDEQVTITTIDAESVEQAESIAYGYCMDHGYETDSYTVYAMPTVESAQAEREENLRQAAEITTKREELTKAKCNARKALLAGSSPEKLAALTVVSQARDLYREASEPELLRRKIADRILRDNLRRAIFDKVMPAALEVLRRYEGKRYGPKTKQTIADATVQATGCKVYLDDQRTLVIVPINAQGYRDYTWSYDDLQVMAMTETLNRACWLDDDNRIVIPEHYDLENCQDYVLEVQAHATEIIRAKEAMMNVYQTFERACKAYSDLLPRGMDTVYPGWFRDPFTFI